MSRILHLVRHGEAEGATGRAAGRGWDPPLSAAGREAVERLAATWPGAPDAGEGPPLLFASPLRRARETAELLARRMGAAREVPVRVDPRLAELDFGEWDGRRWDELHATDPDHLAAWGRDWLTSGPPGGESFAEMAERVVAFWQELAARLAAEAGGGGAVDGSDRVDRGGPAEAGGGGPAGGSGPAPVVLVCHGGPIRALQAHLLDLAPEETWDLTVGTGRVSTVRLEPGGYGTAVALDAASFPG